MRASCEQRELLIAAAPAVCHATDHCVPWVLVRLARVEVAALGRLAEQAWRFLASGRAVAQWDAARR